MLAQKLINNMIIHAIVDAHVIRHRLSIQICRVVCL